LFRRFANDLPSDGRTVVVTRGRRQEDPEVGRDSTSRAALTTYLVLTFSLSGTFYWLIIAAGGLERAGVYPFALMWSPAISAIVTQLLFAGTLSGLGWRLPAARWAALAYLLPIVYGSVAYGMVWLTGLGGLDMTKAPPSPLTFVLLGTLSSLISATGEEIGWRGYLVPALARRMSLVGIATLSGGIWAAWHIPLVVFGNYNAGTPKWYAVICFTISVVSLSLPLAWLRLRSGSLWPAALLHASHNLYIKHFFDDVTVNTAATHWFTTEFGVALTITISLTAWLFWRVGGHTLAPTRAAPSMFSQSESRE
jgi:membrane protease YdiL (CAAX protease family)